MSVKCSSKSARRLYALSRTKSAAPPVSPVTESLWTCQVRFSNELIEGKKNKIAILLQLPIVTGLERDLRFLMKRKLRAASHRNLQTVPKTAHFLAKILYKHERTIKYRSLMHGYARLERDNFHIEHKYTCKHFVKGALNSALSILRLHDTE